MADSEALFEISEGVRLWMKCMGEGSPTIIFEAPGPSFDSSPWAELQTRLASTSRTCRYDRRGLGHSGGTELPTPEVAPRVRDLERLLEVAQLEPPYVLAGYSFGGAMVLRYAREHPDRVAGLVLIEPADEDIMMRLGGLVEPEAREQGVDPTLGNIPLAVMTIDTDQYVLPKPQEVSPEEALKAWQEAHARLATLSSRGRQVFVKDTHHFAILENHEEDVLRLIGEVVKEARIF